MAHVEFNLESSIACGGVDNGGYVGVLYHQVGKTFKWVQVSLPSHEVVAGIDNTKLIDLARIAAAEKVGCDIPNDALIALAVTRLCMRVAHRGYVTTPASSMRAERVASLAIAKSRSLVELAPLTRIERRVSGHGIGHGRRYAETDTNSLIYPLIHLPVTPEESHQYYVVAAVEALGTGPVLDKQAYVALHFSAEQAIEQIVTPDQLER